MTPDFAVYERSQSVVDSLIRLTNANAGDCRQINLFLSTLLRVTSAPFQRPVCSGAYEQQPQLQQPAPQCDLDPGVIRIILCKQRAPAIMCPVRPDMVAGTAG